ncbi:1069_t:CDS:2 [Paraglomus occultum]|uniref:1069_t:CDS:1 n=1 Tax=Paraglomus occultum TaxID=144539 RepID=A0A9N9CJL1_9GLOM|nr:1069_t:CDS:2 [Paraglomus occultum]
MTDANISPTIDDVVDSVCSGCDLLIEEGRVVAFGEGLWHIDCIHSTFPSKTYKNELTPPVENAFSIRQSRLIDTTSLSETFTKQSIVDVPVHTSPGRMNIGSNPGGNNNDIPTDQPKKTSKRSESFDSLHGIRLLRNRNALLGKSGTHFRSPSMNTISSTHNETRKSSRSFSLTSSRSDNFGLSQRLHASSYRFSEKINDKINDNKLHRETNSGLSQRGEKYQTSLLPSTQSTSQSPEDTSVVSSATTVSKSSMSSSRSASPPSPRSQSPGTPHSSSPISPSAPSKGLRHAKSFTSGMENGPPVLPPLSFDTNNEDDLINFVATATSNTDVGKRFSKKFTAEHSFFGISSSSSVKRQNDNSARLPDRNLQHFNTGREEEKMDELDMEELKTELLATKRRLADVENSYKQLKIVSKEALEEFSVAKEEFNREVELRQEAEILIHQLRTQLGVHTRRNTELTREKEALENIIEESHALNSELEETKQNLEAMSLQRELMIKEIEGLAHEKQARSYPHEFKPTDLPSSLAKHISTHLDEVKQGYIIDIRRLQNERDRLKKETEQLCRDRDQLVEEAKTLNAKNRDLAELNNELTRQIDGHQRRDKINAFNLFRSKSPVGSLPSDNGASNSAHGRSRSPLPYTVDNISESNNTATRVGRGEWSKRFGWKKASVFNILRPVATTPIITAPIPVASTDTKMQTTDNLSARNPDSSANGGHKRSESESSNDKSHKWHQVSFFRPVKCECCQEKIWGLTEARCDACGLACHNKCVGTLPIGCSGYPGTFSTDSEEIVNMTTVTVFGADLDKQLEVEGRKIPLLVERCITAIENRAMDYEGLYRKPGGKIMIRSIVSAFQHGEDIDLNNADEYNDVSAITSVLKQYLGELPDPLLTTVLYPKFIEAAGCQDADKKLDLFKKAVALLPAGNYATANYLLEHLHKVKCNGSENLMSCTSLAIVFGPTILKGLDPATEIKDMGLRNAAVEFLIENVDALFPSHIKPREDGFL